MDGWSKMLIDSHFYLKFLGKSGKIFISKHDFLNNFMQFIHQEIHKGDCFVKSMRVSILAKWLLFRVLQWT